VARSAECVGTEATGLATRPLSGAAGEIELVEVVQRHALEAHQMALSQEDALLLAFRAELNALSTTQKTPTDEEET